MIKKDAWNYFNFFNLPKLDLWPRMWSILENVPCAQEEKVKFIVLGWKVLQISISSNWSILSFKVCFLANFLFGWSIHRCEWDIKVSHYYCVTVEQHFLKYGFKTTYLKISPASPESLCMRTCIPKIEDQCSRSTHFHTLSKELLHCSFLWFLH